jgi:hypothetical protein
MYIKEKYEMILSNCFYNGKYDQDSFIIKRSNIKDIIYDWEESFPEMLNELKCWELSDEGSKFTHKYLLRPLHRGKLVKFVFLKIYDEGEDTVRYTSISGETSIKLKNSSLRDKIFGLVGWTSKINKEYIKIIKSHTINIVALILSKDSSIDHDLISDYIYRD